MFDTGSTCRRHMLVHLKRDNLDEDQFKRLIEKHRQKTRAMYNRSFSLVSVLKQDNSMDSEDRTEEESSKSQSQYTLVSFNNTFEAPKDQDTPIDFLDDLLNDFNANDESRDTLEHMRKITYPKKQSKPSRPLVVKKVE